MAMLYLRGVWPKTVKNGHKILSSTLNQHPILSPCIKFELNWLRNKKVTKNLIFDGMVSR